MGPLWLYAIVLGIMVLTSFRKKWNFTGKMLLIIYFIIAVFALLVPSMGQLAYVERLDPDTVTYGMVLFLLANYAILFFPYMKSRDSFSAQKMDIALNENYYIFVRIYIVFCVITIVLYFNPLLQIIRSGAWAINRKFMASTEAVFPYSNILEKIIINFTAYFKILALIVGMLIIAKRERKKLGYWTVILASICEAFTDLYVSSRGMLATYFLFIIALILFFFPDFNKKSKWIISILAIIAGIMIAPYLIEITLNRFSESSLSSIVYYFGQPPYGFATEVNDLDHHMFGRFAFGALFGDEKFPIEFSAWVHGFYTVVGWIYADWGYVGTLIISCILSFFFNNKIHRSSYSMGDLFILFSYYMLLTEGVFTIGRTKANMIVITILLYVILKYIFDRIRFTMRNH